MRINKLQVHAKNILAHQWLYSLILLSCLMLMTSVSWATVPTNRTASDILDHAVNLSGSPASKSFSETNGGISFSSDEKTPPNKPDTSIAGSKPTSAPAIQKPEEIVKSKKLDKANDNEIIASLNSVS